jgi:hypothetical protein
MCLALLTRTWVIYNNKAVQLKERDVTKMKQIHINGAETQLERLSKLGDPLE